MTSPEKTAFYALPDDFPTPYAAHAAETSLLVRRGEIEFLGLDEDHYEETGERRLIFRKNGEAK